jgi:hypothetical protein
MMWVRIANRWLTFTIFVTSYCSFGILSTLILIISLLANIDDNCIILWKRRRKSDRYKWCNNGKCGGTGRKKLIMRAQMRVYLLYHALQTTKLIINRPILFCRYEMYIISMTFCRLSINLVCMSLSIQAKYPFVTKTHTFFVHLTRLYFVFYSSNEICAIQSHTQH